jgi:Fur family transcriptional regulator, iron response regulator
MGKKVRETAIEATERLRAAGLRPTRQRVDLAGLLFADGDRHMTAESLHADATAAGIQVSLATVYNTLHQFTQAGLLRQVVVDAARAYFDTNIGDHQHFFVEGEGTLIDIPGEHIAVAGVPLPPRGMEVDRIDVVVRVKRSV